MRKPVISTNGTAMIVSFTAFGASTVDFANVNASQPAITRQTAVSARIHEGGISRSRSSRRGGARRLSVLTESPTTGFASRPNV